MKAITGNINAGMMIASMCVFCIIDDITKVVDKRLTFQNWKFVFENGMLC